MTTIRTLDHPQIERLGLLAKAAGKGIALANSCYNQLGHARGLLQLLPLGNPVDRRRLIIGQFIVLAASLALVAAESPIWALVVVSLAAAAGSTAADSGYHPVPIRNRYGRTTPDL